MSDNAEYYILHDGNPLPCDMETWARWFQEHSDQRFIEKTEIGETLISTVFLGLNHNFFSGSYPLIFETMIFGGPHDQSMWSYLTREQARSGHREACELVRKTEQLQMP